MTKKLAKRVAAAATGVFAAVLVVGTAQAAQADSHAPQTPKGGTEVTVQGDGHAPVYPDVIESDRNIKHDVQSVVR